MSSKLLIARKEVGLTQEQVASAIGIDRSAYSRIENGIQKPSVDVALKIAILLGKKVEEIFLPINVHKLHSNQDV